MDIKLIRKKVQAGDYLVKDHADDERTKDELSLDEIEEAILSGNVIEERLDDPRGESRLIAGKTSKNQLIHVVIGIRFNFPTIVTVYKPSKESWIRGKIRKETKHG